MNRYCISVGLALVTFARALSAQQLCFTPTPTATRAVDGFLRAAGNRAWLQAHGIAAMQASQLRPLVDSTDHARCLAIGGADSTTVAYYLAAGSYRIATDMSPLQPDSAAFPLFSE